MAFYPADWSPVCTDQMALYSEILPEFRRLGADAGRHLRRPGVWCHMEFARQRHLRFPLLADFQPKGEVARRYGVYDDNIGMAERALFIVDSEGTISWSYVSPIGVNPGADGFSPRWRQWLRGGVGMSALLDAPRLTVPVNERDHVQGPPTAPVTLVEYGDYECPFCGAAHRVVHELQRMLGDELRFVFRHFPLTQIHPRAWRAALGRRGSWRAGQVLGDARPAVRQPAEPRTTRHTWPSRARWRSTWAASRRDIEQETYAPRVREDFMSGVRSGVNGTPTFFINGVRHNGGYDLRTMIDATRDVIRAGSL